MCLGILISTLFLVVDVCCQKLAWESSYVTSSKCSVGSLILGQEGFYVQGTLSPFDIIQTKQWSTDVYIRFSPAGAANSFESYCSVHVGFQGFCGPTAKRRCYCLKNIANVVHFVVNFTAELEFSDATLRAVWSKTDGSNGSLQSDFRLPRMYNLSDSRISINNEKSLLVSDACDVTVKNDQNVRFCCDTTTSPTPCNPKINFRGTWFNAKGNDSCIETPAYQGIFNYTLSVCGHDTFGYCAMNVIDVTTTTPPPSTSGIPPAKSDNGSVFILGLLLGLAILLLVGCAILVCYLHRKKNKEDNSTKTTQNPETSMQEAEESTAKVEETADKQEPDDDEGTVVDDIK